MNTVLSKTDIHSSQIELYMAIRDSELRSKLEKGLPSEYNARSFENIHDLLKAISESQPQIILCHNELLDDGESTFSSIKMITSARILIIGPTISLEKQMFVIKHGARGYFDCSASIEKIYDALHSVLHGEVWVKRDVISGIIDDYVNEPDISSEQRELIAQLTPKEIDVAKLVSHGATNKIIANQMEITERTVKAHLTAIFQKLAVPDRLSLAILFRDLR